MQFRKIEYTPNFNDIIKGIYDNFKHQIIYLNDYNNFELINSCDIVIDYEGLMTKNENYLNQIKAKK